MIELPFTSDEPAQGRWECCGNGVQVLMVIDWNTGDVGPLDEAPCTCPECK